MPLPRQGAGLFGYLRAVLGLEEGEVAGLLVHLEALGVRTAEVGGRS